MTTRKHVRVSARISTCSILTCDDIIPVATQILRQNLAYFVFSVCQHHRLHDWKGGKGTHSMKLFCAHGHAHACAQIAQTHKRNMRAHKH